MNYVLNAFSFNMMVIPSTHPVSVTAIAVTVDEARMYISEHQPVSGVGHADTAAVFAAVLGTDVPAARITVQLEHGDTALIGQYSGPRLAEGATELPEGATIKWLLVTI